MWIQKTNTNFWRQDTHNIIKYVFKNYLIVQQTLVDVSPTMESTGADSNDESDMFPSQFGSGVLVFASDGVKRTTNTVVSLDTSSCRNKATINDTDM